MSAILSHSSLEVAIEQCSAIRTVNPVDLIHGRPVLEERVIHETGSIRVGSRLSMLSLLKRNSRLPLLHTSELLRYAVKDFDLLLPLSGVCQRMLIKNG